LKVIDWGSAKKFDPQKDMKEQKGTPYYIAPEVLNGKYN
jgi:serine/threonine protein kinase